jgi:hypothetical protein
MTVTWHVGAILNEPLSDTLRFAAWYLDAGADGLTLLFDNPRDPAIGVLGDHPKITCIPCTPEFWQARGLRQDVRFTKRQNAALTWAYQQQTCDWFLNVDTDEFMYVASGDIGAFLAGLPRDVETVRVGTAEIIASDEACNDLYRIAMERDVAGRVYGDSIPLFGPRRQGLIGHSQGKSFTRGGLADIRLRQHWPERRGGMRDHFIPAGPEVALLHHIGLDYDIWRSKLTWRVQARGFTVPLSERISRMMEAEDAEPRLRALHADLHAADAGRLARMRAEGVCLEPDVSPDEVARRVFGELYDGA